MGRTGQIVLNQRIKLLKGTIGHAQQAAQQDAIDHGPEECHGGDNAEQM